MVEHSEGKNSGECLVGKGHGRSVTKLDVDILISQSLAKRLRQSGVEFKASEVRAPAAEPVGGEAWPWAEFQHVVAHIHPLERPRQDLTLEPLLPPP
jgi:hypothetical protein